MTKITEEVRDVKKLTKDGVTLAYQERGTGPRSIVFIHGLGFDHTTFGPQIDFFSPSYRVITVDLRGHGGSDAPNQDYTMPALADDVAWLCAQLNVEKPAVIGHSMGGNVALALAALHPNLPASILMIDSLLFPPPEMMVMLKQIGHALKGPNFEEAALLADGRRWKQNYSRN
jgi:pimeloyl-ACP methyl ester carboxylesterase